MAFQQSDLDALDKAIASGVLKVRYPDGSEVTYRTLDELLQARSRVAERLGGGTLDRCVQVSL